jgi:flagellar biogenesis protein FliO
MASDIWRRGRSEQIILLLVCGLFYLVTRLMQEGSRLAAQNEAFI